MTDRLVLRDWRDDDVEPFFAMSADPEVMHHYPARYDRAATEAAIARFREHHAREGFGLCAIEHAGTFVGLAGLARVPFIAEHAVEVGWRLARPYWGRGFATEAARASLAHGFHGLGLDEIVAMMLPANDRSRAVALRLGMTRDPAADFVHPRIPAGAIGVGGGATNPHHLYRLQRGAFRPEQGVQTSKT